jgi:hypothetical protein
MPVAVTATRARAVASIRLARITETSSWRRPSPDPLGIAFQRRSGKLLVVDSEVEETSRWAGANVWSVTTAGRPTRSWSFTRFSDEPTDVAVLGRRTVLVTDDNVNRIFVVKRGRDRRFGSRDDRVRSFSTEAFGSRSPQGLTVADGVLFVSDGAGAAVYRIDPGPDRHFDGVEHGGDDVVSSFSTSDLDLTFPSGCAFDAATGHLLLVSQNLAAIVETTTDGQEVARYDISDSGIRFPSSVEFAPSSADATVAAIYVTDRGIDNDFSEGGDPAENDGRLFEFTVESG